MDPLTGQEPTEKPQEGEDDAQPGSKPAANEPQEPTFSAEYVQKLRNEAAGNRTKAKDLEARLQAITDASKSETEKLQQRAEKAAQLEPEVERLSAEVETLTAALQAEADAQKATLPEEFDGLCPEGSPAEQLDWVRKAKAKAKAAADKRRASNLPPTGGRNPGGNGQRAEPTKEQRDAALVQAAMRF